MAVQFQKYVPKTQNGFTLIELLMVIAIIGILASIVLVNLSGAMMRARDAKRKSDLAQMAQAIEAEAIDGANMTSNACGAARSGANFGLCVNNTDSPNNWYIGDYLTSKGYFKTSPEDPDGKPCNYYYYTDPTGTYFQLSATLEDPSAADKATMTNGQPPSGCNEGNYRITGTLK